MSHFSGDHAASRAMRIGQEVRRVEWMETAGELGALLLESRLIKERRPVHNKLLRTSSNLFSLSLAGGLNHVPLVNIVTMDEIQPEVFGYLYGFFRSRKAANEMLRGLAKEHALCPRMIGIESGKGTCFAHQLKCCDGVCAGKENPELHYLRLKQALIPHRLKTWPYPGRIGIREHDEESDRTQLHVFDNWCHVATVEDERVLEDVLEARSSLSFDLDTYKLLLKHLKKNGAIIPLPSVVMDER